MFLRVLSSGSPGTVLSLAMGSVAGTLATTVSYPADLIRKRIIVQEMGGKQKTYGGIIDAIVKVRVVRARSRRG